MNYRIFSLAFIAPKFLEGLPLFDLLIFAPFFFKSWPTN